MTQQQFLQPLLSLALALVFFALTSLSAYPQVQTWNIKARERSQAANSAGLTAVNKGQTERGIQLFLEATRLDPQDPIPFASLGLALAMKGNYQEALDSLQNSYSLAKVPETLVTTGIVYYLNHDYDAAINSFGKALTMDQGHSSVAAGIGYAFLRKGDLNQAEQAFQKVVKASPNSQIGHQGLSEVFYLRGDFSRAAKAAEYCQSISSYLPVVLLQAKLDFLQGRRTAGLKLLQQYNNQARKSWQKRSMTAIGYPLQHDVHFDPFLADNLDNGYLLSARAQFLPRDAARQRSLARQGKAAQVIETAQKQLAQVPNDFWLLRQLGLAQLAAGEYVGAGESFKKVLSLCPDCHVDLLHLGQALSLSGKAAAASAAVRTFQRLHPSQTLAQALIDLGKEQGAASGNSAGGVSSTPHSEPFQPVIEDREHPRGGKDSSPSGF